jgi:hypothetical protein
MKSKTFIIVLLSQVLLFAQNPLKILSSDFSSMLVEFTPVFSQNIIKINDQDFYQISFPGGYVSEPHNPGVPEIPYYNLNAGVPSETGNTIEILNAVYSEMQGRIVPMPKLVKNGDLTGFEYEINENYYNYSPEEEVAAFGSFGISRDLKIQSIKILPVKFDPSSGTIRLYSKIVLRINFAPSQITPGIAYDDLVSGSVVNYSTARYWKDKAQRISKVSNSVLASGRWFRFEVPEEGMYKITRDMLSSFGIDPSAVDPRTIKIYNNGGKMLSEDAGAPRPADLVENAIRVIGEEDGTFDQNDYILFYGRGNSFWDYDTSSGTIKRFFHLYSNVNYYWITSGGNPGKRIQNKPGLNTAPEYVQTTTAAFADWEVDKINVGRTGKIFLGDDFSQSVRSRTYMNTLNNRVVSEPHRISYRFVNASEGSISLKISENANELLNKNIPGYGSTIYSLGRADTGSVFYSGSLPENRSVIKFEIEPTSITSVGYLDYFEIYYHKNLRPANNYLMFFGRDTTAIIEYRLSNFPSTNIKVFDVTDYAEVKFVTNHNLLSGGECRFQFQENFGYASKYIAIGNDEYKSPANPTEVGNSNLRGIADGARFIIITHKNFLEAANRLKVYRENEARTTISTIVVDVEQIFNEFSAGILDVSAVRDFLKYAYDNWSIEPEYVLFFGSGNYDYKNIEGYNQNFVPTWQSIESLIIIDARGGSYTTDDFFIKIDPGNTAVDFATGRITAKNPDEANRIVDKIIDYENNNDLGLWRNQITLVADDGNEDGTTHTSQSETLAVTIPKYYDINKIYMQTYPTVLTGSGRRMPEVNQAIIDAINQGNLIINYIGHGSSELWAHEVVFDRNTSIPQLRNNNRYCFLVAATCSFGYFDIPNFRSGSEDLLFLASGGGIATLTASRLVYSSPNASYTFRFYSDLLNSPRDSDGRSISIGKANFISKQQFTDPNTQKYFIFGDPTMRLNIPVHQAGIDSINGQAVAQTDIQIKALGTVTLNGSVMRPDSSVWDNYSGEAILNVYDSERIQQIPFGNINYPVTIPGGVIFRGRVSITGGRFSAEFVVPKDISYENRNGKVVLYFYSNNEDGLGYTNRIIVGGTDSLAFDDGKGPEIEIYFDDVSFAGSYLINPDSKLIIKLYDETGINTTGTGVGHGLQGILNNNEANPIDFTNHFTGDLDAGGKSGEVNYTFSSLETGDHHLRVQAWDVFNNFSSEETYFTVVTGDDLVIRDVYNYPNPFGSFTTFTFQQNLNSMIDVEVKIYSLAGRQLKVINRYSINDKFVRIDWDGRDDDGDLLANGTYLYKVKVNTLDGEYSKSILGKLAVIR